MIHSKYVVVVHTEKEVLVRVARTGTSIYYKGVSEIEALQMALDTGEISRKDVAITAAHEGSNTLMVVDSKNRFLFWCKE